MSATGVEMAKIDRLLAKASERMLASEQILAAVQGEYPAKMGGKYYPATAVLIATKVRLLVSVDAFYGHDFYGQDYCDVRSIELTRDTKGHLITFEHRSGDREFRSGDDWAKFRHIKDVIAAQNVVDAVSKILEKRASTTSNTSAE